MDRWWKRLRDELIRKGWSVVEFEKRTGIDRGRLYKYVTGEVDQPRGDAFARMSVALGVNEWWLRTGHGARSNRLPLLGLVGAGEIWSPLEVSDQDRRYVDFDLDNEDCVALEVTGASMAPAYRTGDVVICSRRAGFPSPGEINGGKRLDCALRTVDGVGYLKSVTPGRRPGYFTLRSYNPDFPDLEDIQVDWLAPVVWIKRAR